MHRPQDDLVPLHEPFETALRGFNRQQVLAHIESLEGHISMVTADRESALEQVAELSRTVDHLREASELLSHLREEREKINERMESLTHEPIVGASVRIERILRLATEEAADLKAKAVQEATDLSDRVAQECRELRERTDQEIAAAREQAAREGAARLRDTDARCKRLEADSEHRRKAAEQAAEQHIARRESEANDRIQDRERRGLAALQLVLSIAAGQLAQRIAGIEAQEAQLADFHSRIQEEVGALRGFRAKIISQLLAIHQELAKALDQVQPTNIEAPDDDEPPAVPVQHPSRPNAGTEAPTPAPARLVNSRPDTRSRQADA